jgi:hypothetical protein
MQNNRQQKLAYLCNLKDREALEEPEVGGKTNLIIFDHQNGTVPPNSGVGRRIKEEGDQEDSQIALLRVKESRKMRLLNNGERMWEIKN